jgi:hypothetical protein
VETLDHLKSYQRNSDQAEEADVSANSCSEESASEFSSLKRLQSGEAEENQTLPQEAIFP